MATQAEAKQACYDVVAALGEKLARGDTNTAQTTAIAAAMKDAAEASAWLTSTGQPH